MNREEFLARARQAAASGRRFRAEHAPRAEDHSRTPLADKSPSDRPPGWLADHFVAELSAAGGRALVARSWDEAHVLLQQLLDELHLTTALCWQHPHLEQLGLEAVLAARNARSIHYAALAQLPPTVARQAMLEADLGISAANWALAETGTLVLLSGPGSERAASLLPPVHLAVVHEDQILWDLFALVERLEPASLPSNLVLVTGPSKTGDLELQLTTGVHGPGTLIVLLVRR